MATVRSRVRAKTGMSLPNPRFSLCAKQWEAALEAKIKIFKCAEFEKLNQIYEQFSDVLNRILSLWCRRNICE